MFLDTEHVRARRLALDPLGAPDGAGRAARTMVWAYLALAAGPVAADLDGPGLGPSVRTGRWVTHVASERSQPRLHIVGPVLVVGGDASPRDSLGDCRSRASECARIHLGGPATDWRKAQSVRRDAPVALSKHPEAEPSFAAPLPALRGHAPCRRVCAFLGHAGASCGSSAPGAVDRSRICAVVPAPAQRMLVPCFRRPHHPCSRAPVMCAARARLEVGAGDNGGWVDEQSRRGMPSGGGVNGHAGRAWACWGRLCPWPRG